MFKLKTLIAVGFIAVLGLSFGVSEYFARQQIDESGFEIGAPFQLINQHDVPVDETIFDGKSTAVFFGFTHCPDICPTTLSDVSLWREEAGFSAEQLQIVFITIDPKRDTASLLQNYLGFFADDIIGLTGDEEQVLQLVKDWGIYRQEVVTGEGSTTFDHTATIFLLNKSGRLKGTISLEETSDVAISKLQNLVNS